MTAIFLLVVMNLPRQCTEEERYRVLSFFFDGVPVPASLQPVPEADTTASEPTAPETPVVIRTVPEEPTIYVHQPFKERRCQACHQGEFGQSLIEPRIDLVCRHCHDQFNQAPAYIHGPVAVGQCTRCHSPHTAKNDHLLIKPGNTICTQCHEDIDVTRVTAHLQADTTACFTCHDPHFSDDNRFFLRATAGTNP
ncbi:MAG: hypothetical protein D6762_09240 [Candidatus Neomarinimicrobiota bacterium]|nr:MAG: hypothetical protein D6762_09240 [Candidatus Neomarinimicrobiota bacterium]